MPNIHQVFHSWYDSNDSNLNLTVYNLDYFAILQISTESALNDINLTLTCK